MVTTNFTRKLGDFLLTMQRHTRLVRKQPLQRKKPLRRVSQRRRTLVRCVRAARSAFLQEFPCCVYPGCGRKAVCIHEIAYGLGIRQQAYAERCTWLPSCGWHNRSGCGFHDVSEMPLACQCALKWILDRAHYDLLRINALRGRADHAISEAEVQAFVPLLEGSLARI